MVKVMIGSGWGGGGERKSSKFRSLNDTIRQRIDEMAANMCQEVCSKIKQSTLQASIQLDKSTHSTLESNLIAFARYEKDEGRVLV